MPSWMGDLSGLMMCRSVNFLSLLTLRQIISCNLYTDVKHLSCILYMHNLIILGEFLYQFQSIKPFCLVCFR